MENNPSVSGRADSKASACSALHCVWCGRQWGSRIDRQTGFGRSKVGDAKDLYQEGGIYNT